jgi:hypothetical protein
MNTSFFLIIADSNYKHERGMKKYHYYQYWIVAQWALSNPYYETRA